MSPKITESAIESLAIELLEKLGYPNQYALSNKESELNNFPISKKNLPQRRRDRREEKILNYTMKNMNNTQKQRQYFALFFFLLCVLCISAVKSYEEVI